MLLRESFFYQLDKLMPRTVASVPYKLALVSLMNSLKEVVSLEIWARNSFQRGNYVFGVSDLDLTVLVSNKDLDQLPFIEATLASHKKVFLFLGETNLLIKEHLEDFAVCLNDFERRRDPLLSRLLPFRSSDEVIEKVVFLLRMAYSDRFKLKDDPVLRQRKWSIHFKDLGIANAGPITLERVIQEIEKLIGAGLPLREGLTLREKDVYFVGGSWKYLFPHKHVWFHQGRAEDLENFKGTVLAKVCERQIDWELWGLFTQIAFMPEEQLPTLTPHLEGLSRVAKILNPESKVPGLSLKLLGLSETLRRRP